MSIAIEIIYAWPDRIHSAIVIVEEGATVGQAITGDAFIAALCADAGYAGQVGIYGKPVALDRKLQPGDRVEIYRPLNVDPKEIRRLRAAKKR